jgi:glycosyltransferase involved in cell wall biosynthesis
MTREHSEECIAADSDLEPMYEYSRRIQELRAEIDELRLRNQQLHIDLDRFLDLPYLIHATLRTCWVEAFYRLRRIKKSVTKLSRQRNGYDPNPGFKPYQAHILHPIQARRPRVLHAIGNFMTGGSARLVIDVFEHLGHRFEQQVITRDKPDAPAYTGIHVHEYERFTHPRQVRACLKAFKPDIVHVHYLGHHRNKYSELDWKWYNNVFQAAQEYGCKIIQNINIPVEPYISDSINCYVYVSDYVKHTFGRLGARNITIYPGSNFALFSRQDELSIPDDCIGMVYRLEGDKLNERSIDVFIKVAQRRKKTRVLIVGGGRYLELYRALARQAGVGDAFVFTGYVAYEELPALFAQMSIFVAPVHRESFGQVSPFAMHMGIPVVGYNVGALKEITGDRALLAAPGDSDALAGLIIALLDDRARRLRIGALNQRRARDLFSVEAMIDRYSTLYDELVTLPTAVNV